MLIILQTFQTSSNLLNVSILILGREGDQFRTKKLERCDEIFLKALRSIL